MRFKVSREIKIASWSTAILWFGWGFGESLIPVFLYQFADSYTETGLLKSAYNIVVLLVTPIIGYYASKISIKKMMLVGLALYFLVSASYYVAGALTCVLFIILARILNGIAHPLTNVSRESYFYKYAPKNKIARVFGYFDTWSILIWSLAVILSLFLVSKFQIHQLLLFPAPAAIIAFVIALFLPKGNKLKKIKALKFSLQPYREVIRAVFFWPTKLRVVVLSSFSISFVSGAFFFFIPIEVWKENSDLTQIIILAIFYSLPTAAGNVLGWVIDKIQISKSLIISFVGALIVFICSIFFDSFLWRLSALMLIGIFVETIALSRQQLIADYNVKNNLVVVKIHHNFGLISSVVNEMNSMGKFIGIILIGIIIDIGSWLSALSFMSLILIFVLFWFAKNNIINKNKLGI